MSNPWGLTPRQASIVEAVIDHGDYKRAARHLGIAPKTLDNQIGYIKRKMGVTTNRLGHLFTYDRWRRANGPTPHA